MFPPKGITPAEQALLAAAQKGYPNAQFELANYYNHQGRYQDAEDWYAKAALQGHNGACKALREYASHHSAQEQQQTYLVLDSAGFINPTPNPPDYRQKQYRGQSKFHRPGALDHSFPNHAQSPHPHLASLRHTSSPRAYALTTPVGEELYQLGVDEYIHACFDEARELFEQAAHYNHPCAAVMLFRLYNTDGLLGLRDENKADYWRARVTNYIPWLQQQARPPYNNRDAQERLGDCYYFSLGVPPDRQEAVKWLEQAAQQGQPIAQNLLAICCLENKGVPYNPYKAVFWFRGAANQGYAVAEYNLADHYETGKGMEGKRKDPAEARRLKLKAAQQGYAPAQNDIGAACEDECNYLEAAEWYEKAAAKDDMDALRNLGYLYYNGMGVDQDISKAAELWRRAADQGDENAKAQLEFLEEEEERIRREKEEEQERIREEEEEEQERIRVKREEELEERRINAYIARHCQTPQWQFRGNTHEESYKHSRAASAHLLGKNPDKDLPSTFGDLKLSSKDFSGQSFGNDFSNMFGRLKSPFERLKPPELKPRDKSFEKLKGFHSKFSNSSGNPFGKI